MISFPQSLFLASLGGCSQIKEELTGMREAEHLVYDEPVGTLHDHDPLVDYLGSNCEESFDATSGINGMGLSHLVEKLHDRGISVVDVYARWDDHLSTYNEEEGWTVLNCEYFNNFSAWLLTESEDYWTDSYTALECQYFSSYNEYCLGEDPYYCYQPLK